MSSQLMGKCFSRACRSLISRGSLVKQGGETEGGGRGRHHPRGPGEPVSHTVAANVPVVSSPLAAIRQVITACQTVRSGENGNLSHIACPFCAETQGDGHP